MKGQQKENINRITAKDCFMGVAINFVFYFDFICKKYSLKKTEFKLYTTKNITINMMFFFF
ncbi:MAG: hypothetical protein CMP52_02300 [Flavobacteriales bacterium]|nr:hypothetical protein [Candidatus Arcticimaribacter sp.]